MLLKLIFGYDDDNYNIDTTDIKLNALRGMIGC